MKTFNLDDNHPMALSLDYISSLETQVRELEGANVALHDRVNNLQKQLSDAVPFVTEVQTRVIGEAYYYMKLGVPYVFGGESTKGMDCSGLTQTVYASQGVKLPRTSINQSKFGVDVLGQKPQPGDLLFFDPDGDGVTSHVGISLGGDLIIHTAKKGEGINIANWVMRYKKMTAHRRVL